ncbi:MAG TPA: leucyl aminopeptidase [Gemmatimonadaceae bacterium]|nr:leucyl aminopeptidase [Gemmatimonadaceae bacterium]
MPLSISARAGDPAAAQSPILAVALANGTSTVPKHLRALDKLYGGQIGGALRRRDFRCGKDELYWLSHAGRRGPSRVLLVGLGSGDRLLALRRAGGLAARTAHRAGAGDVTFFGGALTSAEAEAATIGLSTGAWEYTLTKTQPPPSDRRAPLSRATVLTAGAIGATRSGVASGNAIAEGYAVTRDLAMLPANMCTPDHLASTARDIAKRHRLKATVLGRKDLTRMKMGAFLAVAQGTSQEPRLVALEYNGGRGAPLVLVGKGLCFDTGGISLKPAEKMELMKFDMCGAAGVLGAMEAIARLKLKINVVGLIGATTNMPSGEAYKPGDVLTAMSGRTIEVVNTDAEGRLVLADLLAYAKRFKPSAVVNAATLTGACVIALGNTATGVMGNDQSLIDEVLTAAKAASEPGWQLPMWDEFKDLIKSDVADIKNSGGRAAGTITAALFLAEFTQDYPWVHLDVAGTAYAEADLVVMPKGPTGTPMGTFVELARRRAG